MNERQNKLKPFIPSIVTILFVLACTAVVMYYHEYATEFLLSFMPSNKWICALIVLLFFVLQGVIPFILYNVVILACSMLFDLPTALLINVIGTLVGMIVPYLLGRHLNSKTVDKILSSHKKLHQLCSEKSGGGFLFAYGLRVSGISNMLLGVFFGSTQMPMGEYLLSSFLGVLPVMLCLNIFGSRGNLRSPIFWVILALDILLTSALSFYYRHAGKKQRRQNSTDA